MKRKLNAESKNAFNFFRATEDQARRQSKLYGDVDSSTASDAVRAAKRRRGQSAAGQTLIIQNTALAVEATAAERLAAWCDLQKTYESLEEEDQRVFAKQYAALAAAARRGMDPEKALTLYATLKAKIDARKKKRKDDAEKKRKKGVRKLYKRRRIKSDGSRGKTEVSTLVRTADEQVAYEARRDEIAKMDPKERPRAHSQMYAPGMTPLKDQSGTKIVDCPKSKVPGTYKNGVFQVVDETFTVATDGWKGPKMKPKYFNTRAEADAQRAEWIRKKWLPKPQPPPNAVPKSTSEAPNAH